MPPSHTMTVKDLQAAAQQSQLTHALQHGNRTQQLQSSASSSSSSSPTSLPVTFSPSFLDLFPRLIDMFAAHLIHSAAHRQTTDQHVIDAANQLAAGIMYDFHQIDYDSLSDAALHPLLVAPSSSSSTTASSSELDAPAATNLALQPPMVAHDSQLTATSSPHLESAGSEAATISDEDEDASSDINPLHPLLHTTCCRKRPHASIEQLQE